jgi:hypothetical protein
MRSLMRVFARSEGSGSRGGRKGGRLLRSLGAAAAATVLAALVASPALAADGTAANESAFTTGVVTVSGGGAIPANVPVAYIQLKQSQLAALASGTLTPQSIIRSAKLGSGSTLQFSANAVSPMSNLSSITINFPGFHQMTTWYCVVAFVQSVLFWDVSPSYRYYGGASTLTQGQNNLYNGPLKGTKKDGVKDPVALSWIDGQFSSNGYAFFYLGAWPSNAAGFMNMIRLDTNDYYEANYVRIDLTTYDYAWGQGKNPDGSHPLHATGGVGYDDSAGTVTSYDPFSYSPAEKGLPGTACTSNWFTSSYEWGCNWTLSQDRYYLAMDKQTSGDDPMWY